MKKKINSLTAGGLAQPEINIGDIYQDSFGCRITITGVSDTRISYVRDGYAHPCISSPDRLRREFTFISAAQLVGNDIDRLMAVTGAERIRVIREIIREKGAAK